MTGTGSVSTNKNVGRPWSNTATLAPKRVTNKVQPINKLNSNNQVNQTTAQLNGQLNGNLINNSTNNLINLPASNQINNQLNSQPNNNQRNTTTNKQGQTLPTIYESNHYKETDLQPFFNSFTSDKAPPVPTSNPPASSSYSNSNKLNSFSVSTSTQHHQQPSAVLKLPINADLNDKDSKTNKSETANPSIDSKADKKENNEESKKDKLVKLDSQKYEEEITIYQRPLPLPGKLHKSSSLEDLFKIKVCKLNPLCMNGDPLDQKKTIIFCANTPLAKIKANQVSNLDTSKLKDNKDSQVESINDGKQNEIINNSDKDNSNRNVNSGEDLSEKKNDDVNDKENREVGDGQINSNTNSMSSNDEDRKEENEAEDKNSLNTAIQTSLKNFLGDLKAYKQNQLALSTFRPLSNGVQQSTGITGTLNTSSIPAPVTQSTIKPDPSVEQFKTDNPFAFKNKKQTTNNQLNEADQTSNPNHELTAIKITKPDITDLLKEFDVCFDDEQSESNDLISFSNDNNGEISFNLPLPPPSMLKSENTTVNICPTSSSSSNCLSLSTNSTTEPTLLMPSNCSSTESLQHNESSLAKLLDQNEHFKQASLGPATLETCGSQIQLTELDLSKFSLSLLN